MENVAQKIAIGGDRLSLLLLDDESEILKSLTRVLRTDYDIVSFNSGKEALEYLEQHEVSIIISDMRMPEMDGADFLAKSKELYPETIRILLTGYSDIQSTVRAVNSGGIHTYIGKPWDNENLKLIVSKAAEFYRLTKEREHLAIELEKRNSELEVVNLALEDNNRKLAEFNQDLEQKVKERTLELQSSNKKLEHLLISRNKTFKDILGMVTAIIQYRTGHPADHAERIANQAKVVAQRLKLPESQVSHVYLCGLMHQIGLIGAKDKELEKLIVDPETSIPQSPNANSVLGAEILGRIKRFEPLVEIIRHQDELYDGTGKPGHLHGEEIPLCSRIIKVVKDYDYYIASLNNPRRMHTKSAQSYIKEQAGTLYDPTVVDAFLMVVTSLKHLEDGLELCIGLSEVKPGMKIKRDLYLPNGNLMLTAGNQINSALLAKLKELEEQTNMPIAVYIG
ncbi:HD domain-containing phosphohydrolase [Vibrio sp. V01_P9A10T6]|uniref:HD domain-containing phosphohydrolase n=1 Tax=Vibrio sp. V01_P9A10T6 TaxID=2116368 RepID=UPI000D02A3F4|nr:HD domain-containing phosphohydrolase [Vibrio sp. V01_P9A10T6]PRQ64358.1 two-component system response regulator [Vibrio sp. V01_P9A10T6]